MGRGARQTSRRRWATFHVTTCRTEAAVSRCATDKAGRITLPIVEGLRCQSRGRFDHHRLKTQIARHLRSTLILPLFAPQSPLRPGRRASLCPLPCPPFPLGSAPPKQSLRSAHRTACAPVFVFVAIRHSPESAVSAEAVKIGEGRRRASLDAAIADPLAALT